MTKKITSFCIIFIGFFFLSLTLKTLAVFLRPFCLSIIVVLVFTPLLRLMKRKKLPLSLATLTLILIFAFSLVLMSLFLVIIVKEGNILTKELGYQESNFISNMQKIKFTFFKNTFDLNLLLKVEDINKFLIGAITYLLKLTSNIFSETFLVLLFSVFILSYFDSFETKINNLLKNHEKKKFSSTIHLIEKNIKIFLVTKTIISFLIALGCYFVFLLFNFPYSLALSFLTFILNFIPTFGSLTSTLLAIIIYALTQGMGIDFIIFSFLIILIQQIVGNVIETKFTGDQLKLNPIVILLSLFFLSYIWGTIGMLIAVPIASIVKIVLAHLDKTKFIADLME